MGASRNAGNMWLILEMSIIFLFIVNHYKNDRNINKIQIFLYKRISHLSQVHIERYKKRKDISNNDNNKKQTNKNNNEENNNNNYDYYNNNKTIRRIDLTSKELHLCLC